jgi:hypothetical protein
LEFPSPDSSLRLYAGVKLAPNLALPPLSSRSRAWEIAIFLRVKEKKTEFSVGSLTEGPTFKFWGLNLGYLLEGVVFLLPIFDLGNPKTNF